MLAKSDTRRRLLVPLDGSDRAERAVPYARLLSRRGWEIVLFSMAGHLPEPDGDASSAAENDALQMLNEVKSWFATEPDLRVSTLVAAGDDPATAIVDATWRESCDLIVMVSEGRSLLGRIAFGGVANRVVRSSSVPVLVIHAHDDDPNITVPEIRRIILPLDGSEFARQAAPVARDIAQRTNVPVEIVIATDKMQMSLAFEAAADAHHYQSFVRQIEQELLDRIQPVAVELRKAGVTASAKVIDGPPWEGIAAECRSGDLIVMTSHGQSGFTRLRIGSVAEHLLHDAPAPVMIVPGLTEHS